MWRTRTIGQRAALTAFVFLFLLGMIDLAYLDRSEGAAMVGIALLGFAISL